MLCLFDKWVFITIYLLVSLEIRKSGSLFVLQLAHDLSDNLKPRYCHNIYISFMIIIFYFRNLSIQNWKWHLLCIWYFGPAHKVIMNFEHIQVIFFYYNVNLRNLFKTPLLLSHLHLWY